MNKNIYRQQFHLEGGPLDLIVSDELFMPNATTTQFSKAIQINPNDTVFDIGSGLGPLAIWSTRKTNGPIYATEIVRNQYEILEKNISEYGLSEKITPLLGSLFAPIPKDVKANVIIGDVSGIAEATARTLGWYPPEIPTGGEDGTEVIIPFLDQAGKYLKERGRVYFPIAIGFSDDEKIYSFAKSKFRKIDEKINVVFPLTRAQVLDLENIENKYTKFQKRPAPTEKRAGTWVGKIFEASEPFLS